MATFKVVWEIQLDAENPLEAAKTAQEWLKDYGANWQFYVQNEKTKEIHSVDLEEDEPDAVLTADYKPLID